MSQAKKQTTAVAPKTAGGALALPFDYGKSAGAGWEGVDGSDFQIPFLNQLQSLSPQCVDGDDAYNADAKPGMFFNSVTQQLFTGDVHFVVALTQHTFVEWRDQDSGGGFVAEYAINDPIVAAAKAKAAGSLDLKTEAGNDLVETFKMYALLLDGPEAATYSDQVVISFSKTKIKRYKQIMTRLRTIKGSTSIPLFAHRLVMTSTSEKNPAGKSYKNVAISPAINNDVLSSLIDPASPQGEIMAAANALREAVTGGSAKADFGTATETRTGGGGKDDEADSVFGADD